MTLTMNLMPIPQKPKSRTFRLHACVDGNLDVFSASDGTLYANERGTGRWFKVAIKKPAWAAMSGRTA